MSRVYEIADQFVGRLAALNPVVATMLGVPGHDHEMTDYSPDGSAAANDLAKDTLSQLAKAPVGGERDRIAAEAMRESLSLDIERYDAGEHLRSISVLTSPIHSIRMSFDLAPRATEQDWANITAAFAWCRRDSHLSGAPWTRGCAGASSWRGARPRDARPRSGCGVGRERSPPSSASWSRHTTRRPSAARRCGETWNPPRIQPLLASPRWGTICNRSTCGRPPKRTRWAWTGTASTPGNTTASTST